MSDLYSRCVRFGLRAYKLTLSPLIGRQCRFMPSCSEYTAEALILHGPLKGGLLGLRRICRCRPFVTWGYDPVPLLLRDSQRGQGKWKCDK